MMSYGFDLPKGAFQVDIPNWAFLLPPYKTKWALCNKKAAFVDYRRGEHKQS